MPERLPFGVPLPAVAPRDVLDAARAVDPEGPRTIEFGIPMRDGVELAADVHLPPAAQLPVPAIVIGTPYDKALSLEPGPFRDAGYAVVVYDVRGRGKSEGAWHAHAADGPDGHDVVEWAAAQEWCTGGVGATGLSYPGWVVVATMAERPPHLRAAVAVSAAGRWQQEIPYTYGCFQLYWAFWFAGVRRRILDRNWDVAELVDMLPVGAIGERLDCVGPSWSEFLDDDALDGLWRSRRWDGRYDFGVPCLHVTGWRDRENLQGAFHHYEQLAACSPERERQWLLVGPWSHVSSWWPTERYRGVVDPGAALDMSAIQVRFFDRFLRGERNGVDEEPRVRLYDTGAQRWETFERWPAGAAERWPAGRAERRLYLAEDGALAERPGAEGADGYRYDPLDPPGIRFDVNGRWEPPLDLGEFEAHEGTLVWTSAPLTEPLTLHGWGELELWAATDGEDTDWHAKVGDVDADGRSLCVTWGCLRASYRESLSEPEPVTPGEVLRYGIELVPAFHTFEPGHRVRVVLGSADFPWFARNLNRFGPIATQADPRVALNTIHRGAARPSALRLPLRPRPTAVPTPPDPQEPA